MDIRIQINGTFLEGLTNTDVKLSVNASSPFQFGESTRTYSATIKAPRNKVNDGVFAQLRNFGVITRDKRYYAKLYIGGVKINKEFRAKVTCNSDSYDIALTQRGIKASELPSTIVRSTRLFGSNQTDDGWYAMDLRYLLQDAFNTDNALGFPAITQGSENLYPTIRGKVQSTVQGIQDLIGSKVTVFWRYAADTEDGTVAMDGNYIDIEEWDIRDHISKTSSLSNLTISLLPDADLGIQEVVLDLSEHGSIPSTLYLRDRITSKTIATFGKSVVSNDIEAVTYTTGTTGWNGIPINYLSRGFEGFYLTLPTSTTEIKVKPSQSISAELAFRIELKVSTINSYSTTRFLSPEAPNGVDLLNSICKMFLWRWTFTIQETDRGTRPRIVVNKLISDFAFDTGTGAIRLTGSAYRQDWSKFYLSTEKIEDSEGIAQYNKFKIGDRQGVVPISKATFEIRNDLFEASVPYKKDGSLPRFLMWNTSTNRVQDWLYSVQYRDYLNTYYSRFSDAVDVTIKAKIPYFYIENQYKEDGIVWFSQLNAFFYVREISDYSLNTQECKVKLTKLNLKR